MKKNNNKVIKVYKDNRISYYSYSAIMALQKIIGMLIIAACAFITFVVMRGWEDNGGVMIIGALLGGLCIFCNKPVFYMGRGYEVLTKSQIEASKKERA